MREREKETERKKLRAETTKIVLSINSIRLRFQRDQLGPSVSDTAAIPKCTAGKAKAK